MTAPRRRGAGAAPVLPAATPLRLAMDTALVDVAPPSSGEGPGPAGPSGTAGTRLIAFRAPGRRSSLLLGVAAGAAPEGTGPAAGLVSTGRRSGSVPGLTAPAAVDTTRTDASGAATATAGTAVAGTAGRKAAPRTGAAFAAVAALLSARQSQSPPAPAPAPPRQERPGDPR
ncbi:hypothetical protein [Streptomyces sp. SP18CS02]|uniref:hypothetical protein n=1 Tax=Streptomyces sp. SP18CS02 TaxID=3002531 RepID=UPI002E79550B|nr:hypothetical protein [Streptomyces sp. SP18CS02]MEE1757102.1 hypothetical protein [Streptomyces sp. SP18CS02]